MRERQRVREIGRKRERENKWKGGRHGEATTRDDHMYVLFILLFFATVSTMFQEEEHAHSGWLEPK